MINFNRISNLLCSLLIIIISLQSSTFASEEYDFRHTKWGMSMAEVKQNESAEINKEMCKSDSLYYNSKLFDDDVLIIYKFAFNKLIWAKYILSRYIFETKKVITALPVADFDKYQKILEKKYGKPKEMKVKFINKELRDRLNYSIKYGSDKESTDVMDKLIREGKAWWYSIWNTKDTLILLYLHGHSGRIIFEISYDSKKIKRLKDEDLL